MPPARRSGRPARRVARHAHGVPKYFLSCELWMDPPDMVAGLAPPGGLPRDAASAAADSQRT